MRVVDVCTIEDRGQVVYLDDLVNAEEQLTSQEPRLPVGTRLRRAADGDEWVVVGTERQGWFFTPGRLVRAETSAVVVVGDELEVVT